jgi:hypothetical protein
LNPQIYLGKLLQRVKDDALKAMDNIFKFKGGALGIAQIALAAKQEGVAGGIDAAISWGVGILTGLAPITTIAIPIGVLASVARAIPVSIPTPQLIAASIPPATP